MVAGGFIALVGAAISGVSAYHDATGIPLLQADSKFHAGEHIASTSELLVGIVGGLPFLVFGVIVILITVNCTITMGESGISATNLLGRRCFHAAWSEVTALNRLDSRPGSGYKLTAAGKTLKIQLSTAAMKELAAEIQHRSPNLPQAPRE